MPKSKGRNQALFDATHRGVLEAARALFATEGYGSVATQRIAEAAGVAHGSVFHHFKSKRDLFIAVYDAYQQRLLDRLEAGAGADGDAWARLDRIWRGYLDAAHEPEFRMVLMLDGPQVIGLAELRQREGRTLFNILARELEALVAAGASPSRSVRALAALLLGALDQAATEIANFPDDDDLHAALITETTRIVAGLKPSAMNGTGVRD